MGKLIIIDGARDVGKSFLIDSLKDPIHSNLSYYKFDFSPFHNYLLKNECEEGNKDKLVLGTSFGKDLQIMQLNKEGFLCNCSNIIMDRGFLSSAVFGVVYGRFSEQEAKEYLLYIQKKWYQEDDELSPYIVYVESPIKNPHDRGKKDKWDGIGNSTKGKQMDLYNKFLEDPDLSLIAKQVIRFENGYDEESVYNFVDLIGAI